MRISDWSSDVCSSDLRDDLAFGQRFGVGREAGAQSFALREVEDGKALEEGDAAGILAAFARAFLLGLGGEAVGIDHGHAMLALADAAPGIAGLFEGKPALRGKAMLEQCAPQEDRKSTRLNSSH